MHLGTEFSGGVGSAVLMAGFIDRRGLCQHNLFHNSKMMGFYFFCVTGLDQRECCGQGPIPTVSMSLRHWEEVHGTVPSQHHHCGK